MLRLSSSILREVMKTTLRDLSVNDDSAFHMIESVISASLRGTDSHGINLFPHYWKVLKIGRVNKNPQFKFQRTKPSLGILDADFALGHHAGAVAMDYTMQLASEAGSGFVVVKDSTHFGAAAYFGLMPAQKNLIGLSFTNADALVKAENAKTSFFGTNPICITAPLENEEPLCLDMATSQVSWNKIRIYRSLDKKLPEGWAFNKEGLPETDPHAAVSLNPAGDYKGFGLGLIVEIFCGILAKGPIGHDIGPMFTELEKKRSISHFFGAIDLSQFLPAQDFKNRLQNMVDSIRQLTPVGGAKVMVPGDPEKASTIERLESGIPMEESRFGEFLELNPNFSKAIIQ